MVKGSPWMRASYTTGPSFVRSYQRTAPPTPARARAEPVQSQLNAVIIVAQNDDGFFYGKAIPFSVASPLGGDILQRLQAAHLEQHIAGGTKTAEYMLADAYAAKDLGDCVRPVSFSALGGNLPAVMMVVSPLDLQLLRTNVKSRTSELALVNSAAASKLGQAVVLANLCLDSFHAAEDNCGHAHCRALQEKWRQKQARDAESDAEALTEDESEQSSTSSVSSSCESLSDMMHLWRHVDPDCGCESCTADRLLDLLAVEGVHTNDSFRAYMQTLLRDSAVQSTYVQHLQTQDAVVVKITTKTMCIARCLTDVELVCMTRQEYIDECSRRQKMTAAARKDAFVGTAVVNLAAGTIQFSHNMAKATANLVLMSCIKTYVTCTCVTCCAR